MSTTANDTQGQVDPNVQNTGTDNPVTPTMDDIKGLLSEEQLKILNGHIDGERNAASRTAAKNTEKKLRGDEKFLNEIKTSITEEVQKTSEQLYAEKLNELTRKENLMTAKSLFADKGIKMDDDEIGQFVHLDAEITATNVNSVISIIDRESKAMFDAKMTENLRQIPNPQSNQTSQGTEETMLREEYNSHIKNKDMASAAACIRRAGALGITL